MSTTRGQCKTNQPPAQAMRAVTYSLMSRPFESGRFQIELVDNNTHELVTRLAFTRAPGNHAAYPQRVDIMVSLQFIHTDEDTNVRWVSKVICTCQEESLIYKIELAITEALSEADAAEPTVVAESSEIVAAEPAVAAESSKTIAEVPLVPDQLQSFNIPVDQRSDQRGTTQSAASEPNQSATSNNAVSNDASKLEMCDRCKSPRTPTYNFCLNCGHSFGF